MKHYLIEPTYKKSVIEREIFDRQDDDRILTMETGWRWGAFIIDVPETEEEIKTFLESRCYDSLEEFLEDHSKTSLSEFLLPNETDEFIDLSEDYDFELLFTDDGCWTDFTVTTRKSELDEDTAHEMSEELSELFFEDGWCGLEENGWESLGTDYSIDCSVTVSECDENGRPLEGERWWLND